MRTFQIFINNRDRLTYTRDLAEQCSHLQMVGDIIIVDNASTYEPLLDWYETCPYKVVKLDKNLGPRAPWTVADGKSHYVVTDNDLDISNVPKHVLDMLFDGLNKHKNAIKSGLSLETEDIPDEYHLKKLVLEREQGMWEPWPNDRRFCKAAIDTTFAMYRPNHGMYRPNHGWIGYEPALRARRPYTARHRPWYTVELDEEERYYLEHLSQEGIIYSGISQAKGTYKVTKQKNPKKKQLRESLLERYDRLVLEESDINEHLPELHRLAGQCKHVTEFGTRNCISTTALYLGLRVKALIDEVSDSRFVCYDKNTCECSNVFFDFNKELEYPLFEFHKEDTCREDLEIEETDLLFIDTWHVYEQLKTELALHSGKVRKWIVLHDTKTFGEHGESDHQGLWKAVEEFLEEGTFEIQNKFENQNGLTVLVRKDKSK